MTGGCSAPAAAAGGASPAAGGASSSAASFRSVGGSSFWRRCAVVAAVFSAAAVSPSSGWSVQDLVPELGGILLIRRDATTGTHLEYRNAELTMVYQESHFPPPARSFDVGLRDEDLVAYADEDSGVVTRVNAYRPQDAVDYERRPRPRGVAVDHVDNTMVWLEDAPGAGGGGGTYLAVSVFDGPSHRVLVTKDAPLRVDGCERADLLSMMRVPELSLLAVFIVCDGNLHLLRIALPVLSGGGNIRATTIAVPTAQSLHAARALAVDPATHSVFVALSDDASGACSVLRAAVNMTEHSVAKILTEEQTVFDCGENNGGALALRGVAFHRDSLYLSSFAPSRLARLSSSIFRVRYAYDPTKQRVDWAQTATVTGSAAGAHAELLLTSAAGGREAAAPTHGFFAPGALRVKPYPGGNSVLLYWLNLFDGRMHYATLETVGAARGRFGNGPPLPVTEFAGVPGVSCPYGAAVVPPRQFEHADAGAGAAAEAAAAATLVVSDHGLGQIRAFSTAAAPEPAFLPKKSDGVAAAGDGRGDGARGTGDSGLSSSETLLATTAGSPTAVVYAAETRSLYWLEPELSTVVAFHVPSRRVLANLTFPAHAADLANRVPARLMDVTYMLANGRVYATDLAGRILSWRAPGADEEFYVGSLPEVAWHAEEWGEADGGDAGTAAALAAAAAALADAGDAGGDFAAPAVPVAGPGAAAAVAHRRRAQLHRRSMSFVPYAVQADPARKVLYVSSATEAKIYAVYLEPDFARRRRARARAAGGTPATPAAPRRPRPFAVLWYEGSPGSQPISSLWLNDGYIHWFETKYAETGAGAAAAAPPLIETALFYKPAVSSDDPDAFDMTKEAYRWSSFTEKDEAGGGAGSRVVAALFYEVHESILPHNAFEAGTWLLYGGSAAGVAVLFVHCCRGAGRRKDRSGALPLTPNAEGFGDAGGGLGGYSDYPRADAAALAGDGLAGDGLPGGAAADSPAAASGHARDPAFFPVVERDPRSLELE